MHFLSARDFQILFLSSFLCLGILTRDFSLNTGFIIPIILTCSGTQFLLTQTERFVKFLIKHGFPLYKNYRSIIADCQFLSLSFLKSSLITALGLCLLLRGNRVETVILAAALAISSKFLFRYGDKHFFNPANFGIISALVLTGDAWVSPGQWGTDLIYILLFCATAGIVLKRVGRWDTSAVFLLIYGGLEWYRDYRLGWTIDVFTHRLSNGSLFLFAFFMITDPRSIPDTTIGRVIWAGLIALLTFILQHFFYIPTAPFWALFCLSPLTVLIDRIFKGQRFRWAPVVVTKI